jgi:hypothetical protein
MYRPMSSCKPGGGSAAFVGGGGGTRPVSTPPPTGSSESGGFADESVTDGYRRLDDHELRARALTHFPDIYFVSIGFTQSTVLGVIALKITEILNSKWPTNVAELTNFIFYLLNAFGICIGLIIVVSEYSRFVVLFRRVIEVRDITFPLALGLSQYLVAASINDSHDAWWAWMGLFALVGSWTLHSSLKHCKPELFRRGSEWAYEATRSSVKRSMLLHAAMSVIFWMTWFFVHCTSPVGWQTITVKIAAYGISLYLAILVLIDSTSFIPKLLRMWDQRGALRAAGRNYAADGSHELAVRRSRK